ncbi:hypothetical protein GRI89_08140 [Altererythrobacter salegens]|uniref:Uncharacterized protein n=1 Tax=Croceibacterium salegens TaxID=1737568 RepID=A0A6I4SVY8_9SPHN|nr:hypothetical protein [Croceibacterium salegens]MXO59509.1 hypothetical protein [Croceibacterium salegens]
MRVPSTEAFEAIFEGAEGRYRIDYAPTDEWDGVISVSIAGHDMRWNVDLVEQEDGTLQMGGITSGTKEVWDDEFWFQIICDGGPKSIQHWGDRVIWREDPAVAD